MPPARYWRDMPSHAFGASARDWITVLPIAAIEQHGPHLPVGVDAIIADGMVSRVAETAPEDLPVTFLPVEEVCKSNEHRAYPGTLTLDWNVVIPTWIQIGESVARAGPRTLVIVTADHGNDPTWAGTDHTRERVPILVHGLGARALGQLQFVDVAASIAAHLNVPYAGQGKSFL